MDFTPSPSQQLLIATARDVLRKHCPPETAQRLALDARGFDDALWRRMAELGWPGLLIPGDLGGSDGSVLDGILLVEEMGRAALPGPFVPSAVVATWLLVAAGGAGTPHRLLPGLASGDRIATLALVEDDGSFDPRALALRCQAPGRLTGAKLFVKDAHVATDPATVTRVLPLTSVCRYLERAGDHVKNLAEEVVYMVRATDVRHRSIRSRS